MIKCLTTCSLLPQLHSFQVGKTDARRFVETGAINTEFTRGSAGAFLVASEHMYQTLPVALLWNTRRTPTDFRASTSPKS